MLDHMFFYVFYRSEWRSGGILIEWERDVDILHPPPSPHFIVDKSVVKLRALEAAILG